MMAVDAQLVVEQSSAYTNTSAIWFNELNGITYFNDASPDSGRELWRTDGTQEGTWQVADIWAGVGGADPQGFTKIGDLLYFYANSPGEGAGVWRTDGTAAGTVKLSDLSSGSFPARVLDFVSYQGDVYFTTRTETTTLELWKSDGTANGTGRVVALTVDQYQSGTSLEVSGDLLYFGIQSPTTGAGLWRSDGTSAGTWKVVDLFPGPTSTGLGMITDVNGTLFFQGSIGGNALLYKSDGTAEGTVQVNNAAGNLRHAEKLINVGGKLYFQGRSTDGDVELWTSDGTSQGTRQVANLSVLGSYPEWFTEVNGTLYFTASTYVSDAKYSHQQTLWRTDGTEAGTVKILGPVTLGGQNPISGLINFQGKLHFLLNTPTHQKVLYKTDGTEAGTVPLITLGSSGASVYYPVVMGDRLFFRVNNSFVLTDTTEAGTSSFGLSHAGNNAAFNSRVFNFDNQLYFVDRSVRTYDPLTKNFTTVINQLSSFNMIEWAFDAGDYLLFADGEVLYRFDGTSSGSYRLTSAPRDARFLTNVNGTVFFASYAGLWKTDGTIEGTTQVSALWDGSGLPVPEELINVGGTLFFTAFDGVNGRELWKSDGTSAGTTLVSNIAPGAAGSNPQGLVNVDGRLYFTADDGQHGRELWTSDGTAEGTCLVRDICAGASGASIGPITQFNGKLYFAANDGAFGLEMWTSDGTASGTQLVADLNPGAGGSDPSDFTALGESILFTANDVSRGRELWRTSGTASSTQQVADIWKGALGSAPNQLTSLRGTIYFSANDGVFGEELWASDGNSAWLVEDLASLGGSQPLRLTVAADTLYFSAMGEKRGRQLWQLADPASRPYLALSQGAAYTHGAPPVVLVPDAQVIDHHSADFAGGTLTVSLVENGHSGDVFSVTNRSNLTVSGNEILWNGVIIGTFSGGNGEVPLAISWQAGADDAAVQAVVRAIAFHTSGDTASTLSRTVRFTLADGDGGIAEAATQVQVRRAVDPPKFLLAIPPIAYEDSEWQTVPGFVTDLSPDDAVFTVTGNSNPTLFEVPPTIDANGSLVYKLAANAYGTATISVKASTTDGLVSEPQTFEIVVRNVNDPPSLEVSGELTYVENGGAIPLVPGAFLSDSDNHTFNGGTLDVFPVADPGSPPFATSSDRLEILNQGQGAGQIGFSHQGITYGGVPIVLSYSNVTDRSISIRFNQNATPDAVQALLRAITFRSIGEAPVSGARTIYFRLKDDGLGEGVTETVKVNVVATDDPWTATIRSQSSYVENAVPAILDPAATLTDPDTANFIEGTLNVSIIENAASNDVLSIRHQGTANGQIGISGSSITYSGLAIGTLAFSGGSLQITFHENATLTAIQALLRQVQFETKGDDPSDAARTISLQFQDADGNSQILFHSVTVKPVNDGARFNLPDAPVYVENGAPIFISPNAVLSDPDRAAYVRLMIQNSYARLNIQHQGDEPGQIGVYPDGINYGGAFERGTIKYGGVNVGAYETFSSGIRVVFTSAVEVDVLQAIVRRVTYHRLYDDSPPALDSVGYDAYEADVSTSSGQRITIVAVNDTPAISPFSHFYFDENRPAGTSVLRLFGVDPDDYDTLTFSLVEGQGSTDNAAFSLNGDILVANERFDFETKSSYSVRVRVTDRGGLYSERTFKVVILDNNDAPVLNVSLEPALSSIQEDKHNAWGTSVGMLLAGVTDADTGAARGVAVIGVSGAANGVWQFTLDNGSNWLVLGQVSRSSARLMTANGNQVRIRFVPNENFHGTASIEYVAWDQTRGSNGEKFNVSGDSAYAFSSTFSAQSRTSRLTITPVNDAPKLNTSLSPTLIAINEDNRNAWGTPVGMLLQGVSDVDTQALKGLAITSVSGAANGVWQYTLDGGASWLDLGAVSLPSARLLPANGNLSRVRFVPHANFHGTVQFGYFAWDQTQGSAGGTFNLSGSGKFGGTTAFSWGYETGSLMVKPVNDAPLLTLPSAPVGYSRNSPAVLLASTATLKDPDSTNFAGGWLKVQITGGADAGDRLTLGGLFKVVNENLLWNNSVTMGTVQGGVGGTSLMIALNANSTLYRVEQLVRSIKFNTIGSGKAGQRTVAFLLSDGLNNSNVATIDLQVT